MKKQTNSNTKTLISMSFLIRQSFQGYPLNWALPFLHGGSLKITLTVPLSFQS